MQCCGSHIPHSLYSACQVPVDPLLLSGDALGFAMAKNAIK